MDGFPGRHGEHAVRLAGLCVQIQDIDECAGQEAPVGARELDAPVGDLPLARGGGGGPAGDMGVLAGVFETCGIAAFTFPDVRVGGGDYAPGGKDGAEAAGEGYERSNTRGEG